MIRSLPLSLVVILAVLQDPPKAPEPKADLYGDPLPAGVVARFGSLRFRHIEDVNAFAFLPDGKTLMVVDYAFIHWWDIATGNPIRPPVKKAGRGFTSSFSGDLKRIVTGEYDRATGWMVGVYDSGDGKCLRVIHAGDDFNGQPLGVGLSDDGALLVYGGVEGQAGVWEVSSGAKVATLKGHTGQVWGAAYSSDGRFVATSGQDKTIRFWNPKTGEMTGKIDTPFPFHSPAISMDGSRIAAGSSEDRAVRVWEVATGKELFRIERKENVNFYPFFRRDGATLAVVSDGTTSLHESSSGREVKRLAGGGYRGALSADGSRVVAGLGTRFRIWDAKTGAPVHEERPMVGDCVATWFSPDDASLKILGSTIQVWDCATGGLRSSREISKYGVWYGVSPDGLHYARSGSHGKVTVHSSVDDSEIAAMDLDNDTIVGFLALSNGAKRLAVRNTNSAGVQVFDLPSGAEVKAVDGRGLKGASLAFSPRGDLLAAEGPDGSVLI
ncbi:MAG TPA: hypothetical protein VGK61_09810 [Planctomycetota bacterium]